MYSKDKVPLPEVTYGLLFVAHDRNRPTLDQRMNFNFIAPTTIYPRQFVKSLDA